MFNTKKFLVLSLSFIFISFSFANQIFNSNLSNENKTKIENGETVFIRTKSYKSLVINNFSEETNKLLNEAKSLNPNYLAEIIKTYPYEGNENLIEKFNEQITDYASYVKIPYWSEHNNTMFNLYDSAKITGKSENGNINEINVDLEMQPFGKIPTQILAEKNKASYYFESSNTKGVKYRDKIECISKDKMKTIIVIIKDNDKWILYGIGGVKAPSVSFVKERIESSFMNRIKTFCSYFFNQFEKK